MPMSLPIKAKIILLVAVFFSGVILYYPVTSYGFLNLDDSGLLLANQHVHSINIKNFQSWFFDSPMNNWVPLTYAVFAMEYRLWGTNPAGYKWVSLILHSLNMVLAALLVYRFLIHTKVERLLPSWLRANDRSCFFIAVYAALIFGFHPQKVEAVAWVSAQKDVLYGFFFLGACLLYLKYLSSPKDGTGHVTRLPGKPRSYLSNPYWWATFASFVLSGLSKGMAVSFPVVMLLLDFIFARKDFWNCLREKIPFFLFAVWMAFMTILAGTEGLGLQGQSLSIRFFNALGAYGTYLVQFIFPLELSPLNYYEAHKPDYIIYIIISGLATVAFFTVCCLRGNTLVKGSLALFIVMLFPVIGFTQIGVQDTADRFTYITSLVLSGWAGYLIILMARCAGRGRASAIIPGLLLVTPLLLLILATRFYMPVWKDSISLWNRIVEIRPEMHPVLVLNHLYIRTENYEKGIRLNVKAMHLFPDDPRPLYFYAVLSSLSGAHDEAREALKRLLERFPQYPETYLLLSRFGNDPVQNQMLRRKAIRLKKSLVFYESPEQNPVESEGLKQRIQSE